MFVKLVRQMTSEDTDICINIEGILSIMPWDSDSTLIALMGGREYLVKGAYEDVVAMVTGGRKGTAK